MEGAGPMPWDLIDMLGDIEEIQQAARQPIRPGVLARLHQLTGLGDAKPLKSLGRSSKGRHYRG